MRAPRVSSIPQHRIPYTQAPATLARNSLHFQKQIKQFANYVPCILNTSSSQMFSSPDGKQKRTHL